ncbi:MAG: hypothetical protein E7329_00635 [Clostridiales bacterium]|nr:hypothetical protein [Clostridiales bacterium]
MLLAEKKYTQALRDVCEKIDYAFTIKAFRGLYGFHDPWFDYASMERCLSHMENPCKAAFRILHLGAGVEEDALAGEIGQEAIDTLIEAGLWHKEDDRIETNNYVVIPYQGLLLVVETNPWFPSCTNHNIDVYLGSDSYRLAENIGYQRGETALDLCSGSSIQGLLCARFARKVVSVELNPKAVPVTRFNIFLNNCEDRVELREGDLYNVLKEGETFDCIYANPPFIPMTEDVTYPICGTGGRDGLQVLRRIVDGLPKYLNPGGEAIIFCECLGDNKGVFFDADVQRIGSEHGWQTSQILPARLETSHQICKLADLTALFNQDLDKAALRRQMEDIYRDLGATYLYSILYRIHAVGNGDGQIRRIRQHNPWDMEDRASLDPSVTTGPNMNVQSIWRGKRHMGVLSREKADILAQMQEGKSISEAAEALWGKYADKPRYQTEGYPAFLSRVLDTCMNLESIGALKRL